MVFSDEEKQKLVQIKNNMYSWLEEKQKLIDGTNHQITVSFGPIYTSVVGDETKSYHVTIMGKDHRESKIWFGNRFSICDDHFKRLYNPNYIYPIMDNWDYIKGEINSYINRIDNVKSKINNFKI